MNPLSYENVSLRSAKSQSDYSALGGRYLQGTYNVYRESHRVHSIRAIPASGSPVSERIYASFHAFVRLTREAQAVLDTWVGAVPASEPIDAALEHALLERVVGSGSSDCQSRGEEDRIEIFHDVFDVSFVFELVLEF